jgi:hypothetical protein
VRDAVAAAAALRWAWWSDTSVFPDAEVRTCALVLERGGPAGPVARCTGPDFEPLAEVLAPGRWTELLAHGQGVPELPGPLAVDGTVGDHAGVTADFREQYYGLVGAVGDDVEGPPLVTSGVIDPGRCRWGERAVRFAGHRYAAPRVDVGALSPKLQRWAATRLVPKVLIASQTRVIEAVADPHGVWLPGVPVVTAATAEPWAVAAVLTSPVASVLLARHAAGTGLSARAVRVRAADVAALLWPAGPLEGAVTALRAGDVTGCGAAITRAYGLDPEGAGAPALRWWTAALP